MKAVAKKEPKIRLTLDLTPLQFEKLQRLESRAGKTKVGIVKEALRLYEYVADQTLDGYSFRAVDKNGNGEDVVFVIG